MKLLSLFALAGFAFAQQYQSIATSKQIMAAMQKPAMDSLAAMMKAGGPQNDQEWATAEQSAAVLAETAQMLLLGSRPLDQTVWVKNSNGLLEAASASAKAAAAKDVTAWKASLGQMGANCKGCHSVHRKQEKKQ